MKKSNNNTSTIEYNISGPAVTCAIQNSVDTKTNIAFVYDKDQRGNIVRIGFVFTSRNTEKQITPIKWFNRKEINVSVKKSSRKNPEVGRLKIDFKHPRENEKHFSILFPIRKDNIRFRIIFRKEKDGTKNFVILLEQKTVSNKWKNVTRYDCSHGFIHKDILNSNGRRVLKKDKLPTQNKKKAIEFAINQLMTDLKVWTQQPSEVVTDIRIAKKMILKLFESPKASKLLKSTMVAFSKEKSSLD